VALASAQFSGRILRMAAVNFSTPVLISTGHLPRHRTLRRRGTTHSMRTSFATSGVDNPPLHALASGSGRGERCLTAMGATSSFQFQLRGHELLGGCCLRSQGSDYVADRDRDCAPERYHGFSIVSSLSASFQHGDGPDDHHFEQLPACSIRATSRSLETVSMRLRQRQQVPASASVAFQTTYRAVVRGTVRDFLGNSMGSI